MRNGQSGRRRGRGGARPPSTSSNGRGAELGNRIEVRQRGNAHQMLEKYKSLARDAQTQGDRVTAEYYMQYADHYHRVLNDQRGRQDDGRQRYRDVDDGDAQDMRGDFMFDRGETEREDRRSEQRSGPLAARDEGFGGRAQAPAFNGREADEPYRPDERAQPAPLGSAGTEEPLFEPQPRRGRGRRPAAHAEGREANDEAGPEPGGEAAVESAGGRRLGRRGQAGRRGEPTDLELKGAGPEADAEPGTSSEAEASSPADEGAAPRRRRRAPRVRAAPEDGSRFEFVDA